jgi:hypothetical protein
MNYLKTDNKAMNRRILTIKDFENISWHDCKIFGFAFDESKYKLYFDIDFISEWIVPENNRKRYKLKIAPATLVFDNVWDVNFEIDTNLSLDIDNIIKENPHASKNKPKEIEYEWSIELLQGEITFKSIGFKLYLRDEPQILSLNRNLTKRGGISFSTTI